MGFGVTMRDRPAFVKECHYFLLVMASSDQWGGCRGFVGATSLKPTGNIKHPRLAGNGSISCITKNMEVYDIWFARLYPLACWLENLCVYPFTEDFLSEENVIFHLSMV